jgi:hypothetical protein
LIRNGADIGTMTQAQTDVVYVICCIHDVSMFLYMMKCAGLSGPAFTMGTREGARPSAEAVAGSAPGPGQYHLPSQPGREAPAYSIASRATADMASAASCTAGLPGPGDYDQPVSWQSGPAYSMTGKAAASGASGRADGPGPGQYDVSESGPEGPSYTMASKLLTGPKAAEGPAPGDYYPEEAAARCGWGSGWVGCHQFSGQ